MTTTVKWHEGRLVGFDTETTGIDPAEERIVTASIVHHTPGQRPRTLSWVIDPGIPIPDEAAAVHGWSADRLAEHLQGWEAATITDGVARRSTRSQALFEIAGQVALPMSMEVPLVAFNAPYDLTILEAECARNDVEPVSTRLGAKSYRGVVDPMVIEKQYDPYRKSCYKAPGCRPEDKHHECGGCRGGKTKCGGCGSTDRTLTSLCAHYGVLLGNAHSADADALAAIRVAKRLAGEWPEVARWRLSTLHDKQVEWRAEQQRGLAQFFRRLGETEKADSCDGGWPLQSGALAAIKAAS